MALTDNIEAMYQQAVADQKGGIWNSIRKYREEASKEIEANIKANGSDISLNATIISIKKENPSIGREDLMAQALDTTIKKNGHDLFVAKVKDESEKGTGTAAFFNTLNFFGNIFSLVTGNIDEKLGVIKSGFLTDMQEAWNDYKSHKDKKGFVEIFSEHTRNAHVANVLGITDANERKQFFATLTSETPNTQTRVASMTNDEQAKKAQELIAEERKSATKHDIKGGAEAIQPEASQADLPKGSKPPAKKAAASK